jgi:hypothetical protein
MSVFTQISNKIQYSLSQAINDPKADAYARQQAIQAQQDADAKARRDAALANASAQEKARLKAEEDAKALAERSQFKPVRATGNVASGIIKGFMNFILALIILYGGHLAANEAIGYKVPFRILSFLYGCIFFFIEIPKMLIRRYWYQIKPPYYTYFPLSTYVPNGDLEVLFLGGFCYKEDEASQMARATVETLYKTAFEKSQIKTE